MIEIAKKAALEAGDKIRPLAGKVKIIGRKVSPTDIYTKADEISEKIVRSVLTGETSFNYLSEDSSYLDKKSEFTWVVDSVDGSIPFKAGMDYWAVSIGLLKDNQPVIGVIYIPRLDSSQACLVWAEKSKGAYMNGKRIRVSNRKKLEDCIVAYDVGHKGHRRADLEKNVAPQIDERLYMPSFACSVYGQAMVATGVYDAYFHHRAFPWDFCAGAIIVEEAGGKVTDHEGKPLDWSMRKDMFMLASNNLIHNAILKILKRSSTSNDC